jgi:hypothetical protein
VWTHPAWQEFYWLELAQAISKASLIVLNLVSMGQPDLPISGLHREADPPGKRYKFSFPYSRSSCRIHEPKNLLSTSAQPLNRNITTWNRATCQCFSRFDLLLGQGRVTVCQHRNLPSLKQANASATIPRSADIRVINTSKDSGVKNGLIGVTVDHLIGVCDRYLVFLWVSRHF